MVAGKAEVPTETLKNARSGADASREWRSFVDEGRDK